LLRLDDEFYFYSLCIIIYIDIYLFNIGILFIFAL